jgi:AraC-like DNA-binding protein
MTDDELKTLRVSSNAFSGNGGVEAFLEIWGRQILRMEMDPLPGHPLELDLTLRALPDFAMASGIASPLRNRHTSALIDNDDFILVLFQSGCGEVNQYGRTAAIEAGQAVLTANGAPGDFTLPTSTRVVNFRLKRSLLEPHVADLDALVARPFPRDNRVLRLLSGYAAVLSDQNELATPELRKTVALHMHDLAALLLGGSSRAGPHAPGLRAARLRAIKDSILQGIGRHDFSIADVARRQQLSASYVRQLLAADGTTFTDFVLSERLARAYRMLTDPRYANHLISAIAYEAGFGDLSYFNRTFRRRYGVSPSDTRAMSYNGP